jgi:hypothetical protein
MPPSPAARRLVALVSSLVLVCGVCGPSSAQTPKAPSTLGAPAGAASRSYDLPGHGALALTVPADWKESISRPPGDLPPTIGFEPASGAGFQVVVTPIWGPPGMTAERFTAEDARTLAEKQGRKILEESVETDLTLKEIKGPQAVGYVFALTDKSLVDRVPAEGEYRCVTQGVVLVGDLLMTVTVLSQEHGTEVVRAALQMLRTARLRL